MNIQTRPLVYSYLCDYTIESLLQNDHDDFIKSIAALDHRLI